MDTQYWGASFAKLFDAYEIKARLFPGLLVLLPAVSLLMLAYGFQHPLETTLGSILATCGGPYLLASFVRTWGQRAQEQLNAKWGGQPSTIMLRHRDGRLPQQTKSRYHSLASSKLGLAMPSAQEELVQPELADQAYQAAADALRPLTNDAKKYPFVFKELVAYGYNRNAYGCRWMGIVVALVSALATLVQAGALHGREPFLQIQSLGLQHYLVLAVSFGFIFLWVFHFTERTVEQAGFSYAKRLWEALDKVPKKGSPGATKGSASKTA